MGTPLRALRPRWLALPGREHMGIELDCPRHPDGHRVELWFANPGDTGPAKDASASYWVASSCDDLNTLTLLPWQGAPYLPIRIGHWAGWLVEGELNEARVLGAGW